MHSGVKKRTTGNNSDICITDQGREFCNKVNDTLLKTSGTRHRITSAYHPQTNGLVKRMNRMTSEILLKPLTAKKIGLDHFQQ